MREARGTSLVDSRGSRTVALGGLALDGFVLGRLILGRLILGLSDVLVLDLILGRGRHMLLLHHLV